MTQAKGTAAQTHLHYAYDAFGNRTTVTKTTGGFVHTTSLQYDIRGRRIQLTDPDTGTTTYGYDALGQLVAQTDAKAQTSTMTYDVLGRLTQRSEPALLSSFYYDTIESGCSGTSKVVGQPTRATTSTGYVKTTCFDALARAVSETTTMGGGLGGPTLTVSSQYDSSGEKGSGSD